MNETQRWALDAIDPGEGMPTRFRILKAGDNTIYKSGVKATVVFDAAAADRIIEALQGRKVAFDVAHKSTAANGSDEDSEAKGWANVEVIDGELWATDVELMAPYADKVKARKYRYFSPTFDVEIVDAKSMRVRPVQFHAIALTNIPALSDQTPLVASAIEPNETETNMAEKNEETTPAAVVALLALAGVASEDGLVSAFKELQAKAKSADSLAARVQELESEKAGAAKESLIAELSAAGKLAPALHDWAKTLTLDALQAFGEVAPDQAVPTHTEPKKAELSALSDEELSMAEFMGQSPDDVQQFKAAAAAGK